MSGLEGLFDLSGIIQLLTMCGVGLATYIGMRIKTEQSKVKAELTGAQTTDREAFTKQVADINQTFAVHQKADELNFKSITDGIQRIETVVVHNATNGVATTPEMIAAAVATAIVESAKKKTRK
jgi:hypothetical protein